jgi:hypothetical protein
MDKAKMFAKFMDTNYVKIKGILHERITVLNLITIRIQKEDGTCEVLPDEYKEEFLHGRSPFLKYLNHN